LDSYRRQTAFFGADYRACAGGVVCEGRGCARVLAALKMFTRHVDDCRGPRRGVPRVRQTPIASAACERPSGTRTARPMLELCAETAEGLPCYSVGARGLRTSHTWLHDGQENVSLLKDSPVRTLRRATHIGQPGSRRTTTVPIAVGRADSSAGNTTPKIVRKAEKRNCRLLNSPVFLVSKRPVSHALPHRPCASPLV